MSRLFLFAVIALVIYYEWEIVKVALSPLIDIFVCAVFLVILSLVLVCEVALIVIGPMAVIFGYDSRQWHTLIAKWLMMSRRWGDTK